MRIICITILFTLLLTGFNLIYIIEDSINDFSGSNAQIEIENSHFTKSVESNINTRSSSRPANLDSGGSWEDTFNDNSKIDLGMTDYIRLISGNARVNNSVFLDPYTIALWHFDEGMGTTTFDDTSNGHDGVLGGDGLGSDLPAWTAGKYGYGLNFDGSNDYVDGNYDAKGLLNELTFTAWAKPDSFNGFDLVVGGFWQTSPNRAINLRRSQTGKWQFNDASYATVYSNNNAQTGIWTHLAGTIDSSGNMKMYLNGVLQSDTTSGASASRLNKFVYIGWSSYPSATQYFDGIIDEVSISKKARTPLEIKDIYENGTGVNITQANLTSEKITLPPGMNWDSIFIDSTKVGNSYINVTILNATDNQPISGIQKFTNSGEFDISKIDSKKYPSIKLNATFDCDRYTTPILHYWSVSWNETNTWHDTIFGNFKVESYNLVDTIDGNAEFQNTGTLRSKTINIPNKCYYDKLRINKTEPTGTSLKVTILDALSNTGIPGFKDLTSNILDLSGLEPTTYPAIKLKATYTSTGQTGILHGWSVNWTKNSAPNIQEITSTKIINRTQSARFFINLSDNENHEYELKLNIKYQEPAGTTWKTDYLCDPIFVIDHWECIFTPPVDAKIGRYYFEFSCEDDFQALGQYLEQYSIIVLNNIPTIWDIMFNPADAQVNRSKTQQIIINASDIELPNNALNLNFKYKSPIDVTWKSNYITNKKYVNGLWQVDFKPPSSADLGWYTINITCNDSMTEVYIEIDIQVLNNLPTPPEATIIPSVPNTMDDIELNLKKSTDVETSFNKIQYWYRWYKDNEPMTMFENKTIIPNIATTKYETWRGVVYPFDGDGVGPYAEAEVIIQNSPPELVEPFNSLEMFEDSPIVLENHLHTIFQDADFDEITFSINGQEKIDIVLTQKNGTLKLTPDKNWYGSELITISATDKESPATKVQVEIHVNPTNDLPRITQVGSQIVTGEDREITFVTKQNEKFRLPISVEDVDGDVTRDMIHYSFNITEQNNLYFDESENALVFNPTNDDVGWKYLNLKVTDNNETPPIYISQDIRIQVLNDNDLPSVSIISPSIQNRVFLEGDNIVLECKVSDIDLFVPDSKEGFTYLWYTNKTEFDNLGTTRIVTLTNTTLKPGFYNLTVKVRDSGGDTTTDSIFIEIKARPKDDPEDITFSVFLWLGLFAIIIIIAIILVAIFVVVSHKKKRRLEAIGMLEGQVIQPDATYLPPSRAADSTGTLLTPHLPQPQIIQSETLPITPTLSIVSTDQPTAQLPPVQPTIGAPSQPEVQVQETKVGIDSKISPQEKLELLEERLLRGEVDQDIYLNLKAKYEIETQQYQPAPQLPPAGVTPSTPSQPPPTPEPVPVSQPVTTQAQQQVPQVQQPQQPQTQMGPQPQVQTQLPQPQQPPPQNSNLVHQQKKPPTEE